MGSGQAVRVDGHGGSRHGVSLRPHRASHALGPAIRIDGSRSNLERVAVITRTVPGIFSRSQD